MKTLQRIKPIYIYIFGGLLMFGVGVGLTLLVVQATQNQEPENVAAESNSDNSQNQTTDPEPVVPVDDEPEEVATQPDEGDEYGALGVPPVQNVATKIIYKPDGDFSGIMRQDIEARITSPLIDYNNDQGISTTSITIEYSSLADYDLSIDAQFGDGSYTGFLHGNGDGSIPWWKPECFEGVCNFSTDFKAKYPEVVK